MATKSCIHCGRSFAKKQGTRDHVPSRLFLKRPYPDNVVTVLICTDCNSRFSTDEEYFAAFLGMMLSSGEGEEPHPRELSIDSNFVLQGEFETSIRVERHHSIARCFVEPDQDRLNSVIAKNARGHWHKADNLMTRFEVKKVLCVPLENLPIGILRKVFPTRNEWTTSQAGSYRFHLQISEETIVRSIISEYLYTETHLTGAKSGHQAQL